MSCSCRSRRGNDGSRLDFDANRRELQSMLLSLVIPCFNEEASLPPLFEALDAAVADLEPRGHTVEVIAVDDGSRDRSRELLKAATAGRPRLRARRLSRNFGHTAAMAAAFADPRAEV